MVERSHVAADRCDLPCLILFKGDQSVIADLPVLNGLVHGLGDDPGNGIGYFGGSKAGQQRPHLHGGSDDQRQHAHHHRQSQRPDQHSPVQPAPTVEKAGSHGPPPFPAILCGNRLAP